MKRMIFFILCTGLILALLAACAPAATAVPTEVPTSVPPTATPVPASPTASAQDAVAKLHWFGTSAFLYNGSKIIYFDPVTLDGNLPKADIILITHAHNDHYSVADLQKIIGPNTALIISPNVSTNYESDKATLGITATILNEGDKTEVNGVSIQAVPAYDTTFHPKGSGGEGYLVTVDGIVFYMAGATDAYPEMANYTSDIAFIPVYSKNRAQAIADILPAKMIVLEHTSIYAAQAVATLFNQSYGNAKNLLALQPGPYNP